MNIIRCVCATYCCRQQYSADVCTTTKMTTTLFCVFFGVLCASHVAIYCVAWFFYNFFTGTNMKKHKQWLSILFSFSAYYSIFEQKKLSYFYSQFNHVDDGIYEFECAQCSGLFLIIFF